MYTADAKFAKNSKDMGTVCHKNDVEIFLFCQKNYAKEKIANFPPPALVLAYSRICWLSEEKRQEYFYF